MDEIPKKKSYRTLKIILLIVVLFAVGVGIAIYFIEPSDSVWTNDANINAFGTNISANITEKIIAIYVDEGDFVVKGERIAQFWNNIPLAQKATAEARIKSLEEQIAVQEARLKKIRNDYIRAHKGIENQVVSAQDYDHAEKNLEIAEAELKSAYANFELAQRELEVIHSELRHYDILAPQDGVIAKRWIWFGDVTVPGQSLFTIYDLKNVWVEANLEEYKIKNVKLGDPVDICIDAYPGLLFQGNIFTIKGAAASQFSLIPQNNATGNYTKVSQRIPIKITIKPPDNFPEDQTLYLFPGMSVEVTIKVKS